MNLCPGCHPTKLLKELTDIAKRHGETPTEKLCRSCADPLFGPTPGSKAARRAEWEEYERGKFQGFAPV